MCLRCSDTDARVAPGDVQANEKNPEPAGVGRFRVSKVSRIGTDYSSRVDSASARYGAVGDLLALREGDLRGGLRNCRAGILDLNDLSVQVPVGPLAHQHAVLELAFGLPLSVGMPGDPDAGLQAVLILGLGLFLAVGIPPGACRSARRGRTGLRTTCCRCDTRRSRGCASGPCRPGWPRRVWRWRSTSRSSAPASPAPAGTGLRSASAPGHTSRCFSTMQRPST